MGSTTTRPTQMETDSTPPKLVHQLEVDAYVEEPILAARSGSNSWRIVTLKEYSLQSGKHEYHWLFKDGRDGSSRSGRFMSYKPLTFDEYTLRDRTKITFAPLHSHTIPFNVLRSPSDTEVGHDRFKQLLYYYSPSAHSPFLVLLTSYQICKYDVTKQQWCSIVNIPVYLRDARAFIADHQPHKMYLVSPNVRSVIDLETNKWNMIACRPEKTEPAAVEASTLQNMNDVIKWKYLSDDTETEHVGIRLNVDEQNGTIEAMKWPNSRLSRVEVSPSKITLKIQELKTFCSDYSDFQYDSELNIDDTWKTYVHTKIGHEAPKRTPKEYVLFVAAVIPIKALNRLYRICLTRSPWFGASDSFLVEYIALAPHETDTQCEWMLFLSFQLQSNEFFYRSDVTLESNIVSGLIADRFCVVFDITGDRLWIIDLVHSAFCHGYHGHGLGISFKSKPVMAYDEVNGNVHFLNHLGQHFSIRCSDLIPSELLAPELVFGFLRESKRECSIFIPVSLWNTFVCFSREVALSSRNSK